eukprot:1158115-Pelagomonas_calceolata.AAC.2
MLMYLTKVTVCVILVEYSKVHTSELSSWLSVDIYTSLVTGTLLQLICPCRQLLTVVPKRPASRAAKPTY